MKPFGLRAVDNRGTHARLFRKDTSWSARDARFADMPVVACMNMQSPKTPAQAVPTPVRWVASSKDDLSAFPNDVKTYVGGALWDAQTRLESPAVEVPEGFGDAGVLEVVVDFDGNTFRTVHTVQFAKAVYVLHAFQKRSRRAIVTPRAIWISSELGSLASKRQNEASLVCA